MNRPATGLSCKVGKYIVYAREFEELCMASMEAADEISLLVIDEIGKMELFSDGFESFVKNLLTSSLRLKIIATVPLKSPSKLIDKLKTHHTAQLFHITKSNRDEMFPNVVQSVKKLVG